MNGRVHAAAGVVFGLAGLYVLHKIPEANLLVENSYNSVIYGDITHGDAMNACVVIGSSWLGSLLPDIDHPTSTMSKKFFLASIPYRILQFIFGKFKYTKDFVGHRGITHSLLFLSIPILLMLFVFDNSWLDLGMVGLSVGIFSHLFMDMLNPMGVPLFLPFAKKKFRLLPKKICIKTK